MYFTFTPSCKPAFIVTISMATGDSTRGNSYVVWVDLNLRLHSKCTIASYKSVYSQGHCVLWSSELERIQPPVCICSKSEQLRLWCHAPLNLECTKVLYSRRLPETSVTGPVHSQVHSPVQSRVQLLQRPQGNTYSYRRECIMHTSSEDVSYRYKCWNCITEPPRISHQREKL